MRKRFALMALCLAAPFVQAQTTHKLCYEDTDNFPWHVKDGHGLSNNLVTMAAAKSGTRVDQVPLPWKRCLSDVASGAQAGAFGASYNDERAAYAVYPTTADGKLDAARRLKTDGYSLYRVKGSAVSWDGKQFSHLNGPVGAQIGYSVVADLRKLGVPIEEGPVSTEIQMKKLTTGRIQVIALLTNEGDDTMELEEFFGKVEKLSPPLSEKPYFVIFNKEFYAKNKKAVDDFWAGLASARDSKEFKAMWKEKMKK